VLPVPRRLPGPYRSPGSPGAPVAPMPRVLLVPRRLPGPCRSPGSPGAPVAPMPRVLPVPRRLPGPYRSPRLPGSPLPYGLPVTWLPPASWRRLSVPPALAAAWRPGRRRGGRPRRGGGRERGEEAGMQSPDSSSYVLFTLSDRLCQGPRSNFITPDLRPLVKATRTPRTRSLCLPVPAPFDRCDFHYHWHLGNVVAPSSACSCRSRGDGELACAAPGGLRRLRCRNPPPNACAAGFYLWRGVPADAPLTAALR
jgi:hypothetical protein